MEFQFTHLINKSLKIIGRKNVYEYSNILFVLCVFLTGYYEIILDCYFVVAGLLMKKGLVTIGGTPIGHDFIAFYSAGKLARNLDPSAIYSFSKLYETQVAIIGTEIYGTSWIYPPTYLLIMVPLSFLPYLASFCLWASLTIFGYLLVLRYILPYAITPWLFLGFPGAVYNLIAGHNGCFSTILLGAGLQFLERNAFAGGVLLGILSYKPQIAGLLPMALLAGRYWKALGGFAVGTGGLVLISLIIFGFKPWVSFWENIPYAATHWQTAFHWAQMPTVYGFARSMGGTFFISAILQGITTVAAVSIMTWAWIRRAPLPFRSSILVVSILLSSPYLFVYDLALLSLPFAWLGRNLYINNERTGQILLMTLWLSLYWSIFWSGQKNLLAILIILSTMFVYAVFKTIYSTEVINVSFREGTLTFRQ